MIPIADHQWFRIKDIDLPEGHRAEWAPFGPMGFVVRIVGPRAHVFGEHSEEMSEALDIAMAWFESVGGEL